jgi:hypothetical protein
VDKDDIMRRVIQRTVRTTKIVSLTITHSEEQVDYTLLPDNDQLPEPAASDRVERSAETDKPAQAATGDAPLADRPEPDPTGPRGEDNESS